MPDARIVSALVLIPAVVVLIVWLPARWFAGVSALLVLLAAWEWARMAGLRHGAARGLYVAVTGAALAACYVWRGGPLPGALAAAAVIWWCAALGLVAGYQAGRDRWTGITSIKAAAGFAVLVPAWSSLVALDAGYGPAWLLFVLVLVWVADSAAYFTGRRWGRTRLAARVSPGKSVEGVCGALLAAVAAGLVFAVLQDMQMSYILPFLAVCLVTALGSVVGDLMESMMKRSAQMKDSGRLIPGHGGLFDRIDSLTAAAPLFLTGVWLLREAR